MGSLGPTCCSLRSIKDRPGAATGGGACGHDPAEVEHAHDTDPRWPCSPAPTPQSWGVACSSLGHFLTFWPGTCAQDSALSSDPVWSLLGHSARWARCLLLLDEDLPSGDHSRAWRTGERGGVSAHRQAAVCPLCACKETGLGDLTWCP